MQLTRASRRETVWWTESNFLGLFPKAVRSNEIAASVIITFHLSLLEYPYRFWAGLALMFSKLLRDTVAKVCASPSPWFIILFLLVRGWGLGTRLVRAGGGSDQVLLDIVKDGETTKDGWHIRPCMYPPLVRSTRSYFAWNSFVLYSCKLIQLCIQQSFKGHTARRFRLLQPYFGHLSCIPFVCMIYEVQGLLTIWTRV